MRRHLLTLVTLVLGLTVVAPGTPAGAATTCFAYVTSFDGGTVSVIDTTTNTLTTTIPVSQANSVAVSPDGATVYVSSLDSNTVSVIDAATNTVTATITVPNAGDIAVSPDGATAYVIPLLTNTVSVIDTATNTITTTIDVESRPNRVAFSPEGTKVYVTHDVTIGFDNFSVIDTATNTATAAFSDGGANPRSLAISPDGATAYVVNNFSKNLSVIDLETNTVTALIDVGILVVIDGVGVVTAPYGVALTPDGSTAYITNDAGKVLVMDTATNTIASDTIDVGAEGIPGQLAITPDGAAAYVPNSRLGTVSVIDIATTTVSATIDVGEDPWFVAIGCPGRPGPGPAITAEAVGDGRTVSIAGSGFPADATVEVTLGALTLGTATTSGTGDFSASFTSIDCSVDGGTLTATAGAASASTEVTLTPCDQVTPVANPRFTG